MQWVFSFSFLLPPPVLVCEVEDGELGLIAEGRVSGGGRYGGAA